MNTNNNLIQPTVEASEGTRQAIRLAENLPILDVGPYLAGEPGALEQLAADVKLIQEGLGFFAIVNHGLDPELIEETFKQTAKLFDISMEEKLKNKASFHHQGFIPPKASLLKSKAIEEKIAINTKKDTNSAWVFMRNRDSDDPKVKQNIQHRSLNKWPESLPEFKKTLMKYHSTMEKLALKMLPIYARALGLSADYFDSMFKTPEIYQRCGYYHPEKDIEEGQYALAPHSDGSFLTLLPMTPIPGLEVMKPNKDWLKVKYVKDAIIVNTGQVLNRLSNDRFIATPHRVVNPPEKRYAITFFFYPDDDANVGPIPELLAAHGEKPLYEERSFHDWFVSYLGDLYHYDDPDFVVQLQANSASQ
jgi:isopenicillin N synthase-like dioxygenase